MCGPLEIYLVFFSLGDAHSALPAWESEAWASHYTDLPAHLTPGGSVIHSGTDCSPGEQGEPKLTFHSSFVIIFFMISLPVQFFRLNCSFSTLHDQNFFHTLPSNEDP